MNRRHIFNVERVIPMWNLSQQNLFAQCDDERERERENLLEAFPDNFYTLISATRKRKLCAIGRRGSACGHEER